MAKEVLVSPKLPATRGIFSHGTRHGNTIYVSGQVALDSQGRIVGTGDIKAQTRQVLENIKKALTAAGATFKDIIRVHVFVTDLSDFRAVHDVRLEYFDPDHLPASTLVQVAGLAHADALIEIDAVAAFE